MKDDTISRRAVLKLLSTIPPEEAMTKAMLIQSVKQMDAAQPERKRGRWIYNSPVTMKCDQCGLVIKDWDWHRFKFCPNCDCDMRGEENG